MPIKSSGFARSPFAGTCTCRLHFPKSRSRTSSTPLVAVGGATHSCSATWSRPVMPKSTRPSPTKVGISAAGRNTRASGWFLTSAISRRECRWNWMSEPWRRSRQAWWRRPSVMFVNLCPLPVVCRRRTLRHRKEQAVVQAVAQEVSHERKTPAALARSLRDSLIITCAIGVTHCGRRGLSEVGKRMEKGDKRNVRVDEIHPSESSTQLLGRTRAVHPSTRL